MLQRCKTNGFHRRSGIVNANVAAFAWSLLCLFSPFAHSLLMPQPKSMSSSSPRHECALLPRRSSSVCAPVCVRVSVYAFILIYYGHGFFGTKICLLYKKRKQRQANKKSRTTVRGRGPSGPVPAGVALPLPEQSADPIHTHTHTRGHTRTHTLV